ncbi:amidase [Paracoccus sp. IB05]|uniref:amidase n=1 Tax=Paracoccus sp. IB05 TaxID=2779367 RepID=UPI0018E722CE|nr:amidase family protein [Paracoccus sp. IB05]MBJ2149516.1 amidase [Paracoccus sp. IB05]
MGSDATALASAIRRGHLTAAEAMEASFALAEARADLGALAHLNKPRGRALAGEFDALPGNAPQRYAAFGGVPLVVKDLGAPFLGFPVCAGSALFSRDGLGEHSQLAARFRAAGLCPFALTTVPEFGLSLASEPAVGPVAKNPLDPQLSPGGSSGGAAVAVAAGIAAIAHATDAGGSIRVPAAACGLVGLKPGRGSVPGGPGFGNHLGGIASELAICRSVRDAEAIFAAATIGGVHGPFASPLLEEAKSGPLTIGLVTDMGPDWPVDEARVEAVEAAARVLARNGHRIRPLEGEMVTDLAARSGRIFADIVSINLAELSSRLDFAQAEQMTRAVVARGLGLTASALWASLNEMVYVARDLWRIFDGVDLLLTPMLSGPPLPAGSFPTGHSDTDLHFDRMARFAPLASLANISGAPAITLPFGADAAGLPLPVQLIAPMGQERLLLSIAARLEVEERWTHPFAVAGLT